MALNEMMNRFRLTSHELFNHFFYISGATGQSSGAPPDAPAADGGVAWDLDVRFSHVEEVLFEKLVHEPARLTDAPYGSLQSEILVELNSDFCPIMLNREVNSGYWDSPIREVTRDARLLFFRLFDWDVLAYHDNATFSYK